MELIKKIVKGAMRRFEVNLGAVQIESVLARDAGGSLTKVKVTGSGFPTAGGMGGVSSYVLEYIGKTISRYLGQSRTLSNAGRIQISYREDPIGKMSAGQILENLTGRAPSQLRSATPSAGIGGPRVAGGHPLRTATRAGGGIVQSGRVIARVAMRTPSNRWGKRAPNDRQSRAPQRSTSTTSYRAY